VGAASALVPALAYTAAAWLANLVATLAPGEPLLVGPALLLWAAAGALLFVVVVWFRDDDWLVAGFILSVTLLLSAWVGNALAESLVQRSLAPALFAAPGMFLGVVVRAALSVPLLGGLVALLRWLTRKLRPARPATPRAPAA
jgi:hypothetical protein